MLPAGQGCFGGELEPVQYQLAERGTEEHTPSVTDSDGQFFGREYCILKSMMFRDETTVLNEREQFKMVDRTVPESVSLILG